MLTTTQYPVLFTYRDVIIGAGYVAHVEASGRFLIEDKGTDEDVWIYGVNPGGLRQRASVKKRRPEAFRSSYRTVLIDLAEESTGLQIRSRTRLRFSIGALVKPPIRIGKKQWPGSGMGKSIPIGW